MKYVLGLFLILCAFSINACGAGLPTDILSVQIDLKGQPAFKLKGFPKALSSQRALKSTRMLTTRENLEWMENKGILVRGFCDNCELHLATDVTKSRFYTNQPWFGAAVAKAALLRKPKTVLLWTDPQTFVQARAELPPPNPPTGRDRNDGNARIPRSEECELNGEICFTSDGTASFSLGCGEVSFSLDTKGEFSIEVEGAKGASSTIKIGGKDAR